MNPESISPLIKEKAPVILAEIQKAKSVLLHCHPSPDPDSLCSALAMKFALETLGLKATVIRGDTEKISPGLLHFPGTGSIVPKNFGEVDLKEFDLFIILDSGSPGMISYKNTPVFPLPIKSIVIDHHASNEKYADINLVDVCSSTAFIVFQLLDQWGIKLTHDIAINLFMGMYTDSGGFKYSPVSYKEFEVVAQLVKIAPDFTKAVFTMENSQTKESIYFDALALNSIETFLNDNIAISSIRYDEMIKRGIVPELAGTDGIPNKIKSVIGWNVGMTLIEYEPNKIKASIRSRDAEKFDVSKLAVALGGGGHRAAAGIKFSGISLEEAKKLVVAKAKELYNL